MTGLGQMGPGGARTLLIPLCDPLLGPAKQGTRLAGESLMEVGRQPIIAYCHIGCAPTAALQEDKCGERGKLGVISPYGGGRNRES